MTGTNGKKRAVSLLLALLMLTTAVPALADNALGSDLLEQISEKDKLYGYFEVYAEYGETDDEGRLPAEVHITLRQGTESWASEPARNVVIHVEGQDGLEIAEGSDYYLPEYDMAVGESVTLHLLLAYNDRKQSGFDEGGELRIPEPTLIVTAYAANTQTTTYTCRFDGTAIPRAMVMGWKGESNMFNNIALDNDVDMMYAVMSNSYYNGRRTESQKYVDHENFWDVLESMKAWETDGNDITYIYLNAHGPRDLLSDSAIGGAINLLTGNVRYIPGFIANSDPDEYTAVVEGAEYKTNVVLYRDMFAKLREILKGRVVIILEICYSGQAVDDAFGTGLVDEGYTVIAAAPRDEESDVGTYVVEGFYDLPSDYGVFTKTMVDCYQASDGTVSAQELMAYCATEKKEDPIEHVVRKLNPQMASFEDEIIFCSGRDKWLRDPELVVMEETIEVEMDWPRIYYGYLREKVVPEIGLAASEVSGVLGKDAYFWTEHNPELSGLLSAAVCDFDMDGMGDLLTVSVTPRGEGETGEVCYSMDLTLYQYEKGEVIETDRYENAVEMVSEHGEDYLSSASISVVEYEGEVDLYVASVFTPVSPLHYDYSEGRYLHLDIKDGSFIETEGRPRGLNYYTIEGEPFAASEPRTMSYDAEYLLRMKYRRENYLKDNTVDYLHEMDPCIYAATDLTRLKEFIEETAEPECYNLIRVTTKDEFKSDFERASEANSSAVNAALGALADECGVSVSTNEETLLVDQIRIYAPEMWGWDDEKMEQLQQAYSEIIQLDALGLTADEFARLSEYELDKTRDSNPDEPMTVSRFFVPGDMLIIIKLR